jgi:AraC family transcriptional activator of pobA
LKTDNVIQHKFSDLVQGEKVFDLYVSTCQTESPKQFNIQRSSRSDFFSIGIVVEGEVNLRINLKKQKAVKNSLLFMSPNTVKQIINKSEDARVSLVAFTSKFLLQTGIMKHELDMIDFIITNNAQIINLTDSEVASMAKNIEDLKQKNELVGLHPFGENIVQHTFRIFLYEMAALGRKYNLMGGQKKSRKQDLVVRFGNLMNLYFKEQRSVKYYAEQLSITPKYLTEVVNEVTGKSAGELIDEKVVQEVKFLLNNSQYTIGQIADTLHFSDQSFLRKFFKRISGVSPSEYRNNQIGASI